jgi:hypothetical protein
MKRSGAAYFAPGSFAILLAALIGLSFPLVLIGWESFCLVDYGQFAYPLAFYHRESFWQGEVPLWNPYNSCGVPFLAEWNTLVLYPMSVIYLLLPLPWSLGVFCLGHMFLGGMGMYCLAQRWVGHRLSAAVAGAVFAFNGLTWYGLMWPSNTAGWAWMPWVVLAVDLAVHRAGQQRLITAALAAGMQLLAGAPEVTLQTWIVIAIICTAQWVRGVVPRRRLMVRVITIGGLATGLAAMQLLPFLQLLAHSSRSANFGGSSAAGMASMPLTGWLNYLVPQLFCQRSPQGVYFQANQTWTGSYYLGTGIIALAVMALGKNRPRLVCILAGLAGFSLFMALGSRAVVYDVIRRAIPPIEFMRFPVKFVILATFVLPLLSAFGLRQMLEFPSDQWPQTRLKLLGVAVGLVVLMVFALVAAQSQPGFIALAENTLIRVMFLVLVIGCVVALRHQLDLKLNLSLQAGLIILLWLDVFTHAPGLSPTVPNAAFQPDQIRRFFNWDHAGNQDFSRAMQSPDAFWKILASGSADPVLDTQCRRLSLFMNLNLLDHAAKLDGLYPLDLRLYLDVFKQLYFTTNQAAKLKDFLAINRVTHPTNVIDWVSRTSALPLVTAGQKPVFADAAAPLSLMVGDQFDPLKEVYLPAAAQGVLGTTNSVRVQIEAAKYSAHWLQVEITAEAPSLLVVAQSFYPAWKAKVDGKPTRLWRANHAFQALEIPTGKHQVTLQYHDSNFYRGAALSLGSLAVCAFFLIRTRL